MITLSDKFLEPYTLKIPPFGGNGLGEFIYLRTYSRLLLDKKRREKWWETVKRVVEYNINLYQGTANILELQEEAEKLYDAIYHLKILPSGRSLWIGGSEAAKKFPSAAFNCSFVVIDSLEAITDLFHLLMVGAGVGFRILPEDIAKLPKFYKKAKITHLPYEPVLKENRLENTVVETTDSKNYIIRIGDSKGGWVDGLRHFLNLLTNKSTVSITFDYNSIRPKGELLKTFGGRAAGPDSVKEMFAAIYTIIQGMKKDNRPIDFLDICNIVAYYVVVGGVRRSSEICLFDINDNDVLNAKKDLWTPGTSNYGKVWRSMSNNSIFFKEKPEYPKLTEIMKLIRENGEPGFVNAQSAGERRKNLNGINPCLSPDTMVLTKNGHFRIDELVGKSVEIWDGNKWVLIDNFRITAENQPTWNVFLSNGQKITATEYHSFILNDGSRKELKDLEIGDILAQHDTLIDGNVSINGAYLKGFLIGDGTSDGIKPILNLYHPKFMCSDRLLQSCNEIPVTSTNTNTLVNPDFNDGVTRKSMSGLSARKSELLDFTTIYKDRLPDDILNWKNQNKYDFIAGLLDSDGTATDSKNGFSYQICSISEQLLLDLQLLLKTIGIKSKISLNKKAGMTDFGETRGGIYPTKPIWRLVISQSGAIRLSELVNFSRLTSFANRTTVYILKNKETKIERIEFNKIEPKVYCCTVPETHSFSLSNGVLIGQCAEILLDNRGVCNLGEINISAFVESDTINMDKLSDAIQLLTRVTLRQTNVTLDLPAWDFVQKRDRLLGVSIMGWCDTVDKLSLSESEQNIILEFIRRMANIEAAVYSVLMHVPEPLLVTTVKPGGTLPLLPAVSSGVHRSFSPYYIRRVRITATDPLAKVMQSLNYPIYPESGQGPTSEEFDKLTPFEKIDVLNKADTWVIEFPMKSPTQQRANGEPAVDQLSRYLQFQKYYTDHNTSITIYVGDDEWDDITRMIYENWDNYIAVSFLPKDTNSYPLMPYEEIDEKEYQERYAKIIQGDIENLLIQYEELELSDDLDETCATGICPTR